MGKSACQAICRRNPCSRIGVLASVKLGVKKKRDDCERSCNYRRKKISQGAPGKRTLSLGYSSGVPFWTGHSCGSRGYPGSMGPGRTVGDVESGDIFLLSFVPLSMVLGLGEMEGEEERTGHTYTCYRWMLPLSPSWRINYGPFDDKNYSQLEWSDEESTGSLALRMFFLSFFLALRTGNVSGPTVVLLSHLRGLHFQIQQGFFTTV